MSLIDFVSAHPLLAVVVLLVVVLCYWIILRQISAKDPPEVEPSEHNLVPWEIRSMRVRTTPPA